MQRIAESTSDVDELLSAAGKVIRRAVPAEGWCGFTLDPDMLVKTAGVHEAGLSPALFGHLATLEYRPGDSTRFVDLARTGRPAAILTDHRSSERFHEILKPSGYAHELRMVLLDQARAWGGFVFLREPASPPFTQTDSRFVTSLGRVLARGVRRSLLRSQTGAGSLSASPGLLLLDEGYQIVSMSAGTETLLAELVERGATQPLLPAVVYALAAAVSETAGSAPMAVRVPTRTRRWATFHAWRLDGPVRVGVSIGSRHSDKAGEAVLENHGLSPRERQITELVLRGRSTAQMADSLYLSPHTVRDHLKSIFAKTGVRSRHELVAVLLKP